MTKNEISYICQSFLNCDLTPEDFYNQYIDVHDCKFSYNDCKTIISLLYNLKRVDSRIIEQTQRMEALQFLATYKAAGREGLCLIIHVRRDREAEYTAHCRKID